MQDVSTNQTTNFHHNAQKVTPKKFHDQASGDVTDYQYVDCEDRCRVGRGIV
jgi:hypothetical protein